MNGAVHHSKGKEVITLYGLPKEMNAIRLELCGCDCKPSFRQFISKKEKKEYLEKYRDQLKKEIEGVEESIKELEKK